MKKITSRKLALTTESLRILNAGGLRAVRGGTKLVTIVDPITAPTFDCLDVTERTCLKS